MAATDVEEWRPKVVSRLLAYVSAIAAVWFGVFVLDVTGEANDLVTGIPLAIAVGLVPAVVALLVAHRIRIRMDSRGLTVVNLFTTRQVPWSDVMAATPGHGGITIDRSTGAPVLAQAVQKSNLAQWRGSRTRADAVADAINGRAGAGAGQMPIHRGVEIAISARYQRPGTSAGSYPSTSLLARNRGFDR